jgi:predicted transcriptional regulator of viral defense system
MEIKRDLMDSLLRTKQTLFTFKEVNLISGSNSNPALLRRKISYYVKKGQLYSLRKGIYSKDKKYDKLELANRIYTPSYISFETVLSRTGILFKKFGPIYIASYLTRELTIDDQAYSFRKISDQILTNVKDVTGIENKGTYSIATPERAFLDVVYLNIDYTFDNLSALDWEKVFEILPIYQNKQMEARVKKYYEHFKLAE